MSLGFSLYRQGIRSLKSQDDSPGVLPPDLLNQIVKRNAGSPFPH